MEIKEVTELVAYDSSAAVRQLHVNVLSKQLRVHVGRNTVDASYEMNV